MPQEIVKGKWDGSPVYDRPLGGATEGTADKRPIVTITDFSTCTPAQHIGGSGPGFWDLIDYKTDSFCGKLLHADRAASAPDVELQLNVKGWYAVYVWLMGGDVDLEKQYPSAIGIGRPLPAACPCRTPARRPALIRAPPPP